MIARKPEFDIAGVFQAIQTGSYGLVVKAYVFPNADSIVAIKINKSDPISEISCALELNVLCHMKRDHDIIIRHVVSVIDSFTLSGHKCIVFNYFPSDLRQTINDTDAVSPVML